MYTVYTMRYLVRYGIGFTVYNALYSICTTTYYRVITHVSIVMHCTVVLLRNSAAIVLVLRNPNRR